jgi:hypothetical protein
MSLTHPHQPPTYKCLCAEYADYIIIVIVFLVSQRVILRATHFFLYITFASDFFYLMGPNVVHDVMAPAVVSINGRQLASDETPHRVVIPRYVIVRVM